MEFNATFIVAFISFIVFTVIMNLILYKPINDIVLKRKQLVDSNYNEANINSEKKEAILNEKQQKIQKANEDAKGIIAEKTSDANLKKDEMTFDAKKEAQKNIDAYNLYYKNATNEAAQFLKNEVVKLAQAISDKFLDSNETITEMPEDELFESVVQR